MAAAPDIDLDALQTLLDTLPQDFEAMDVVMIDGWLVGVLLQPQAVPEARWLPPVIDFDGRPPPPAFDLAALREALRSRHAALNRAIERREWFDPWVYELEDDAGPSDVVMPWVAGFASALDVFPALMERFGDRLLEPLAALYRHLDPEDLEDAQALQELIDMLEPPADLAEAVEDLVQATLLVADVSRPRPVRAGGPRRPRPAPGRGPRRR